MYYIAKNQKKRLQKLYIINKFFLFSDRNALELLYIMEGIFLDYGHLRASGYRKYVLYIAYIYSKESDYNKFYKLKNFFFIFLIKKQELYNERSFIGTWTFACLYRLKVCIIQQRYNIKYHQ